jgi:hypothetical protein
LSPGCSFPGNGDCTGARSYYGKRKGAPCRFVALLGY